MNSVTQNVYKYIQAYMKKHSENRGCKKLPILGQYIFFICMVPILINQLISQSIHLSVSFPDSFGMG